MREKQRDMEMMGDKECEKWKVLFLSPQISTDILSFHNFLPSPVDFVHVIDSTDLECSWFKRFESDHSLSLSEFFSSFTPKNRVMTR